MKLMISTKSIKNFLLTNILLLSIGIIEYMIITLYHGSIFIHFLVSLFILLGRNYLLMYILDHNLKNTDVIGGKNRTVPKESYYGEFHFYVLKATIVETLTLMFVENYFFNRVNFITIIDILHFIPLSFVFELIFDFFHYGTHLLMHKNKTLYYYLHKEHHRFQHPSSIITFYQNPIDLLITNSIPSFLSLMIINLFYSVSFIQFIIITIYKTYIEIAGHVGKNPKSSSFPQFIWLPRLLGFELYAKDHDLHHTLNNCNYSKRFSLWDKVFGTFHK